VPETRDRADEIAADLQRHDPWSPGSGARARFFAASTAIHVVVLLLLATLSITVVTSVERVDVKIIDEVGINGSGGADSLEDFAGLLNVAPAPRRAAGQTRAPVVRDARAAAVPEIGAIGPRTGRELGAGAAASTNLALGGGGVGGLGGSFGDYVGGLRKVGLDLVLVVDTTESMQFVIDEVKARATSLVESIQRMVPASRIGVVAYRDEGDEYVTRWTDLSFRTDKLRSFLATLSASGGGDWEEAILQAFETAERDLNWRQRSKKIIILIGGSPPHPEDVEVLADLVERFHRDGGFVSAIDVTDSLHLRFSQWMWRSMHGDKPFEPAPKPAHYADVARVYGDLARSGGGELLQLADDKQLIRDVLLLTFGQRWKVEMAQYLKDLDS